jgi:glycosyltransferase involved in cell wall biosynthesis
VPIRLEHELRLLGADVSTIFADAVPVATNRHVGEVTAPLRMVSALNRKAASADIVDIAGGDGWLYSLLKRVCRPWQRIIARSHGLWFRALEVEPSIARPRVRRFASSIYQSQVPCRWERAAIRTADLSIFAAGHDAEDVVRLGWASAERVAVIAPGVDGFFESSVPLSERAQVAFVGTLHYRKGADILATAMSAILLARPHLQLTLFGPGMPAVEARQQFDRRVAGRIEVVDTLPPAELARRLGRFAIFVLPTRYEGFGLVVLEAMRAGLAVVVTPTGAGADVVRDGKNGLIVPIGDATATKRAIESLLDNHSQRIELAEAGRAEARLRSWHRTARDLLAAYQSTLSRPPC